MTRSLILARGLAVSLLLATGVAHAQQAPVTGRMLGDTAPASVPAEQRPAPPQARSAPPPPARHAAPPAAALQQHALRPQPGDVTRHLLQLQASGVQGGHSLPVLGDQAHASYARYLKSFEHEIPEFFENTVSQSSANGGN